MAGTEVCNVAMHGERVGGVEERRGGAESQVGVVLRRRAIDRLKVLGARSPALASARRHKATLSPPKLI